VEIDVAGTGVWKVPAVVMRVLAPPAVRADLRRAARIMEASLGGLP
jgi:hypothetical protein